MTRLMLAVVSICFAIGCATMPPVAPSGNASLAPPGARAVQDWPPPEYEGSDQEYEPAYDPYDPYGRPQPRMKRFAWDVRGLFGFRSTTGGNAEDVVESPSPLFGVETGPVILVGNAMGISPGMLIHYSPMEAEDFDIGWYVISLGINFRWLFVYQPRLAVYAVGDIESTSWEGHGTDGFVSAADVDGTTLGLGAGVDFFVTPRFSIGGQLAYRDFDGDRNTTARWLDFTFYFMGHF